jgi:hypothetical protein
MPHGMEVNMAKQLTIFVENKPGRMKSVSDILLENNHNIWAFSIQDRGEFGLMKVIVDRPQDAHLALGERGLACALKEVLAIRAQEDRPGNLDRLTSALAGCNINISDAYGFASPEDKQGLCFLEIKNPDNVDVESVLNEQGFSVISDDELYEP